MVHHIYFTGIFYKYPKSKAVKPILCLVEFKGMPVKETPFSNSNFLENKTNFTLHFGQKFIRKLIFRFINGIVHYQFWICSFIKIGDRMSGFSIFVFSCFLLKLLKAIEACVNLKLKKIVSLSKV